MEAGEFVWPRISEGVMRLSRAQYEALVEGLDWKRVVARRMQAPTAAD
ncbi:IS66 family insertion sequence element accessory protein TnpB [Aquibaculum arenosum]